MPYKNKSDQRKASLNAYYAMMKDPIRREAHRQRRNARQRKRNAERIANRPEVLGPYLTPELRQKIRSKVYYLENKDRVKRRSKLWKSQNPEKVKASNRKGYIKNHHKYQSRWLSEEAKASVREYQRKRPVEIKRKYAREKMKRRRDSDLGFRLLCNLRRRVNDFVSGKSKSAPTMALLGIDLKGLKRHLEDQFSHGMSWDNYGKVSAMDPLKWHIDHIIPCSWFNLEDPNQQRDCFNYRNLQPMWGIENIIKNGRIAA